MNGEHQAIFDKIEELQDTVGEIRVNAAETRQDIKYLSKSMDDYCNRTEEDITKLQKRTNWNENKIYMGIGGIGLLALVISGGQYIINGLQYLI